MTCTFFFLFERAVATGTVSASCSYQNRAIAKIQPKLHKMLPKAFPRHPRQPTLFTSLTSLWLTVLWFMSDLYTLLGCHSTAAMDSWHFWGWENAHYTSALTPLLFIFVLRKTYWCWFWVAGFQQFQPVAWGTYMHDPSFLPKHHRGSCKLRDKILPGLWQKHKGLSTKKKKHMYSHFADPKAMRTRFHDLLHTPKTFQWACMRVCARACGPACWGRRERRRGSGRRVAELVLFPVYSWKTVVSACPHAVHGNDLGGDQSMGWSSIPRGCPYHGLDASISARPPAAAALSPKTSCPRFTNTGSVFHQLDSFCSPTPLPGPEEGLTGRVLGKRLYSRTKVQTENRKIFQLLTAAGKPRSCVQGYWKAGQAGARCEKVVASLLSGSSDPGLVRSHAWHFRKVWPKDFAGAGTGSRAGCAF